MEAVVDRRGVVALDDRDQFADFVRPHWPVMAGLAGRLAPFGEGEDVLQEALSAAWRKRAQYDATRGTARSWLLAVVADQAYKGRRRSVGRREEPLRDLPVDEHDRHASLDVAQALRQLTPRQQTAVALHYYLGLPITEAAEVMGCSDGTVKSTLSDARARLRLILGEEYR